MYRIKWRQDGDAWRVTVQRQVGPHTFEAFRIIEGEAPNVAQCEMIEDQGINEIKMRMRQEGCRAE